MSLKSKTFLALAAAALAVPAIASAQPSYGQSQNPQTFGAPQYDQPPAGQPDNGRPKQGGSGQRHQAQFGAYPQFQAMEKHIRHTVRKARRSNVLAPRQAHNLMAQLHRIEADEMQVYQAQGMNLPTGDQARIESQLTQLAQTVDQTHARQ